MKRLLSGAMKLVGIDPGRVHRRVLTWSLRRSGAEQGLGELVDRLREIEPDVSRQYTAAFECDEYIETKIRTQQAFQCSLMLRALELLPPGRLTVVDIGDSAGSHMHYLCELSRGRFEVETIGVNLDPVAVEKIRARGQRAIQCRAEELDLGGEKVDLLTSFEMLEHLHDPAGFLRRIARSGNGDLFVVTVPWLRASRVGLYSARTGVDRTWTAEDEHVFELSPEDWTLLFLHGGWRVIEARVCRQYPRRWPLLGAWLGAHWRKTDFEGFWGAILKRDLAVSDRYRDWSS